jgi:cardiolipin synthase A/B
MTILIAIPVFRVQCKLGVDKGRRWSVIEELVLWSMTRQSRSIAALSEETGLPQQIIAAAIARLMRFRLVEVTLLTNGAAFRASDFGFRSITSGNPLPFYPKRISKRANFVIEWASGEFFHARDVSLMPAARLDQERNSGAEIRTIAVEGGGPSMSHESNLRRLSEIAAGGWNEEVALVDGRTALLRDDEFMIIRVIDGNPRGLPERAGPTLKTIVADVAALPAGTGAVSIGYAGPREDFGDEMVARTCGFEMQDLIIGGSEQRACFVSLLEQAQRRVIIHSTFLDAKRFEALGEHILAACHRGVGFDFLWGAESDDDSETRNSKAAVEIARMVRNDPAMHGRVRVHMRTTGSHAKLTLLDTNDGWIGAVGSCNWLSSPFQSVELTVVLRDNHVVADLASALQRMVGRRGLADNIATEMALTARDLRRTAISTGTTAKIAVVVGESHDRIIRHASGAAQSRFFVGSNRLGSTARPGAIMQGEVAAAREGLKATVLYTQSSGPLKNRHSRALEEEAVINGVRLVRTRKIPLHGKIMLWDDNDVVVTSLNWASASANPDFPWADIGIHIESAQLAQATFRRLCDIFPDLLDTPSTEIERMAGS